MYGGVGTGKTMLMDLFVDALGLNRLHSRTHFNQFMLDIQKRIHNSRNEGKHLHNKDSLMELIIQDYIQKSHVICFDEFQVLHIADAMLLQKLFTIMWQKGVVVIATSNRPPEDLYKNGLQRQLFLPFIDLLKKHNKVLMIKSDTDYRMTGEKLMHVYQLKETKPERKKAIDEIWSSMFISLLCFSLGSLL
jgi:predicted ATPase